MQCNSLGMQQERPVHAESPLRCLEFYSGIGGMHCALAAAFPHAIVTRAFDISPAANDAYESVFGRRPWQVVVLYVVIACIS